MSAFLFLMIATWIAAGIGRTIVGRFKVLDGLRIERFVISAGVGLGIVAYAVLFLGLAGMLSVWPITSLWILLAILGYRGILANTKELIQSLRRVSPNTTDNKTTDENKFNENKILVRVVSLSGVGLILVIGMVALLACFKPPDALSWDALSYHLADPKLFLLDHRISSLPTEHHSNFPFLMEMLYTVGLLYDGYALANLFHLLMGLLTGLVVYSYCQRHFGSLGAWCAIVMYLSTPVVLWEAGVSYIELGLGLYTTLACFAVVEAITADGIDRRQWLLLSGMLMGLALGTKYLALIPFGIIAVLLLFRTRNWRPVLLYAVVALAVSSPWYIKNVIVTHNPVYPYIYKLFPGSRYWSADRARGYESEQSRFGTEHSLKQPLKALPNLFQIPWDLITLPLKDGVTGIVTYSNAGEFSIMTLLGSLYFAFNGLLLLRRRVPRYILDLCVLGMVQVVAWFFVAQVSRYLVSILPLLAVTGAYAVSALASDQTEKQEKSERIVSGALVGIALSLIGGQALMTLWIVFLVPPALTPLSVPQIVNILSDPGGKEEYLKRYLETYDVIDWINHHTLAEDKVLLYDDTKGFYLDRQYLWADGEHSSYIPYDQFADGKELTDWMVAHGYRYALFNMKYAPLATDAADRKVMLRGGPEGELAFEQWYRSIPFPSDSTKRTSRWRALVGDAIRRGLWTEVPIAQHGVYLMHIGPMEETVRISIPGSTDSKFLGRTQHQ